MGAACAAERLGLFVMDAQDSKSVERFLRGEKIEP